MNRSLKAVRIASNFEKVLGGTPVVRLWDFLITSRGLFDYSMTDICEATGIAWNTLKEIFPAFARKGVVRKTREIGRAKMYQLDEKHPNSLFMIGLHNAISMAFVHGGNFKLEVKVIQNGRHTRPVEVDISRKAFEAVAISK